MRRRGGNHQTILMDDPLSTQDRGNSMLILGEFSQAWGWLFASQSEWPPTDALVSIWKFYENIGTIMIMTVVPGGDKIIDEAEPRVPCAPSGMQKKKKKKLSSTSCHTITSVSVRTHPPSKFNENVQKSPERYLIHQRPTRATS